LEKDWAFKKIPYAKKPKTQPVILSLEEVCSFIKSLINLNVAKNRDLGDALQSGCLI
jgi:hypothetical protein